MLQNVQQLKDWLIDFDYQGSFVFENPDYISAVIGVERGSGSVVYDYDLMVKHLMDTDNLTEEEATDFIEFNTIRTIPYMNGGAKPIIIERFPN